MKKKFDKKTLIRLLEYIFKEYKIRFIIVIILDIISALTAVVSSLFIEKLIDNYITPMLTEKTPNFEPLLIILLKMV